jgi:hypothetical protein
MFLNLVNTKLSGKYIHQINEKYKNNNDRDNSQVDIKYTQTNIVIILAIITKNQVFTSEKLHLKEIGICLEKLFSILLDNILKNSFSKVNVLTNCVFDIESANIQ